MTSWVLATDNSALVTSAEEDSQFLLKVFAKWYTWASFIIKVSKCKTFDIKDYRSKSIQFKPYLWTNNELIPPVKINESFSYLGKENSIDIKPNKIKETLLKDLNQFMKLIDRLPLHPKNKIMIASRHVYSKRRWNLSIYEVPETWTIQNLDLIGKTYVKKGYIYTRVHILDTCSCLSKSTAWSFRYPLTFTNSVSYQNETH